MDGLIPALELARQTVYESLCKLRFAARFAGLLDGQIFVFRCLHMFIAVTCASSLVSLMVWDTSMHNKIHAEHN